MTSGNGQVTLSWTAPSDDGGTAITSYYVYQNGVLWEKVTSTTTTFNNLTNGQEYIFTVEACNSVGNGTVSSYVTSTPLTTPSAPTGLTATPGNGQVVLQWTAPSSNGGAEIGYYQIYQDGVLWESVTYTTATFSNLTNGEEYTFTVTASNSVGIGPASSSASATPATVPGQLSSLSAVAGNGQVTLSWTAPNSNGAAIIGYAIYRSTSELGYYSLIDSTSDVKYIDTGLTNGQTYWYMVFAVNSVGEAGTSPINGTTPNNDITTVLSISGSTTANPMIQLAADWYMTNDTNVQISVDSVGSGAGLSALESGSCDIAMLSSTVSMLGGNPVEFQETEFAYDGIVLFIGSQAASYHGLTSNEMVMDASVALKMYEGYYTTWGALESAIGINPSSDPHSSEALTIYYRSDDSGTQTDFAALYMNDRGYFSSSTWTTASKNSTFVGADGNTGMITDVEGNKDGVGFTSFGLISSDTNAAPFSYNPTSLTSGQVFASKTTIMEGVMEPGQGYGCTRALELVTMGAPSAADEAFISYMLTVSVNEALCNETGFVSIYAV